MSSQNADVERERFLEPQQSFDLYGITLLHFRDDLTAS